jgi:hypothetical protein
VEADWWGCWLVGSGVAFVGEGEQVKGYLQLFPRTTARVNPPLQPFFYIYSSYILYFIH